MDYQVILSPSAHRDLRDIVRYISFDSPDRALSFGRFLITHTKSLGQFPEWGRVVPEFGDPDTREIVVHVPEIEEMSAQRPITHRNVDHSERSEGLAAFPNTSLHLGAYALAVRTEMDSLFTPSDSSPRLTGCG